MRWHDVPCLDGLTDPMGTISSPYGSLGISGPLRLAPGQPPLVGEELGVPGIPVLPPRPPTLVPMAPSPAWAPPSLSLSATTTAVRDPIPTERPPPEWPRPPRPQPNGRVPFRGYGELAPSAPQMDANFSTSPLEISPPTMAKQGWGELEDDDLDGYGVVVTANRVARLRYLRDKLRAAARKRRKKTGPWSRASARKRANIISVRLLKIRRAYKWQMQKRRGMPNRRLAKLARLYAGKKPRGSRGFFRGRPRVESPFFGGDPSIDGYGGNLIASNHYGDLGVAEILVERRSSAPAAISAVVSTLRNIGKNAGLDTAAAISVREKIPVSAAALEVISTRGMGEDDLQRRIAQLEAKAAVAKNRRQRRKHKELRVRIVALRSRLSDVRKGRVQGVKDMKAVAGDKSRIPPWVTYAGLALGAASVVIAVVATRKGSRKSK